MYTHCKSIGITLFTVSHRKTLWRYHEYPLIPPSSLPHHLSSPLIPHPSLTPPSPLPHPSLTPPSPLPHPSLTPPSPLPHPSLTPPSPLPHPSLTPPSPLPHPSLTPPSPSLLARGLFDTYRYVLQFDGHGAYEFKPIEAEASSFGS